VVARSVARLAVVTALICVPASVLCAPAIAAPADLDRSFGGDGIVEVPGPGGASFPSEAGARMAIGPKDEIFVLSSNYPPCNPPFNCTVELTVARYGPDGEQDTSFGAGAGPQLVVHQNAFEHNFGLAVGPDGKPVVTTVDEPEDALYVARLGLDGRLDGSFGVGGKTEHLSTHTIEVARGGSAVAVQPDGKILVAAETNREPDSSELILARYLPNGEFDPGFGSGGEVAMTMGTQMRPANVLVDPGGNISVPGPGCCVGGTPLFGEGLSVARFLTNGAPAASWAGSGRLFLPTPGAQSSVEGVALAPDGGMFVVFEESTSTVSTVGNIVKLLPDGAPDANFGNGGRIALFSRVGSVSPYGIAIDRQGRIVGVGWDGRISVFRLRADGSADRTFNGGQRLVLPYGGGTSMPYMVGLQSSGRIIAFGDSGCCGGKGFALIGMHGGTDHTRCLKHKATIVGTNGPDEITGTPRRDVIASLGGKDTVRGLSGADLICGGKGRDKIFGGAGRDQVRQ